MKVELVGIAQRVLRRLGGCGVCPGPLALRVSAQDARAMQLAKRALAITRAESAAKREADLNASSSSDALLASGAAAPSSRADVAIFHDGVSAGASADQEHGALSSQDDDAFISDLAAATGLHHQQLVVLGSLGSGESACVCLALLHMSVGTLCVFVGRAWGWGWGGEIQGGHMFVGTAARWT